MNSNKNFMNSNNLDFIQVNFYFGIFVWRGVLSTLYSYFNFDTFLIKVQNKWNSDVNIKFKLNSH